MFGAGAPSANSTVILWAESAGAPKQLAQGRTGKDGRFALGMGGAPGRDAVLYLVAKGGEPAASRAGGDNPAIALMTGLQMQTDLAISPTADVWVMDNWQDIASCFGDPKEALSTRCGGKGVTIFYGMAKPVRVPQIGPAPAY